MPLRSSAVLVSDTLRGERGAFEELVRRYERAAWTTCWNVLRDYHATQDAVQETFLEAYRQLRSLRHAEYFGVWLLKIAHRQALRHSTRRASQARDESTVLETAPSEVRDRLELLEAVAALPEHERLIVVLRYFDGHSVADVAALSGRPVGTVTKQLSRALARLRSLFNEVQT